MSASEELEYVDFDVVKEDWTIFRLEDDTLLKSKFILGLVMKKKGAEGEYNLNIQTFTVVIVPKNLWGTPSTKKATRAEIMKSVDKEDMTFKRLTTDGWNVYRLRDGFTLSVKLELAMVSRTKLYGERGERIYSFNIEPIVKGKRTKL